MVPDIFYNSKSTAKVDKLSNFTTVSFNMLPCCSSGEFMGD